jgi:hypothetical protein
MSEEPLNLPESLRAALHESVQTFQKHGIRYALIGGIATSYRGRARYTRDVDFILSVPQITLPGLLDDLVEIGFEFDPTDAIRQWTQEHLTVLRFRGVRVDWLKPVLPLYQHVIDSATPESWLGDTVNVATAESLILTKLVASRPQDLADIRELLAANRGRIDIDWIRKEWASVADADDPKTVQFESLVAR